MLQTSLCLEDFYWYQRAWVFFKTLVQFEKMRILIAASLLPMFLLTVSGQDLGKDLGDKSESRGAAATDNQIVEALKDVLTAGARDAVRVAGAENGFWSNDQIKIPLPDKMASLDNGLRLSGQGINLDQFQLAMNRAAEAAAPSCGLLIVKAIASMSISDPRGVLNSNSQAATEYLQKAMLPWLTKAVRPYVEAAMNKYSVKQRYAPLHVQMTGLTMGQAPAIDIDQYMVSQTLNGLLVLVSSEEQKVRSEPSAQTTTLLKTVFSKR